MTDSDPKADLRRYLQAARDALLWKLDGLSEYDVRRPLTPTGTNLLGLVKHMAGVEIGYFGDTFGRKFPEPLPWYDTMDDDPSADFWATEDETREDIAGLYRRVWAFADETIESTPLDTTGEVPWWPPDRRVTTLHRILVHVIAELNRHAGHADIVRELLDGAIGLRADATNLPDLAADAWAEYREKLERIARAAGTTK
ncbi:DinB family protein [Umezawaea sp. NPDC059074]|uniref:DinB family protein n=1 Tax=Umezawaea sp. NPDC059074 TaxID=3346716 RepID=UPI00367922FA